MENKVKAQRANIKKLVTVCETVTTAPEAKLSKGFLEAKKEIITSLWNRIEDINQEINETDITEEEVTAGPKFKPAFEAMVTEYNAAFQIFDDVIVHICVGMEKFSKPQLPPLQLPENLVLNTNGNNKSNLKLKPIDIPTFSGDYNKWISFISMFNSLIHTDEGFSKLQKIHYLKSCVSGEAERIVSLFDITEESYDAAYEAITERFHNEVILIDTHIISILSQPDLTVESSNGLKELMDVTVENLRALKFLKVEVDSWDPILLLLLVQKLDSASRRLWEQNLKPKVKPTLKEFLEFLSTRFHALGCQQKFTFSIGASTNNSRYNNRGTSSTDRNFSKYSGHQGDSTTFPPRTHQSFHNSTKPQRGCPFRCINAHDTLKCERFLKADARTRTDLAACAKLCKNCLKGHNGRCDLPPGCTRCGKPHHTLLHFEDTTNNSNPSSFVQTTTGDQQQTTELQNHHVHVKTVGEKAPLKNVEREVINWNESVLLATAIILIRSSRDNQFYPFRALLDQASEASYISEYATQFLGLKKQSVIANTTGLGGMVTGSIKSVVDFEIGSKQNPAFTITAQGPVVRKITNLLPSTYFKKGEWKHIQDLQLADTEYYVPRKIDILLGAPIYGYVLLPGLIKASSEEPVAQNTEFGWIISGPTRETPSTHSISSLHLRINLDDQLKRFFEQEEVSKERIFTKEEAECEKHFMENYRRNKDGRFIVALPFKNDPSTIGSTKGQAISRLMKLESRFKSNRDLKEEYASILHEYEDLEHTTRLGPLKDSKNESQSYYLPHHAVFKPESTTTKTRVVFDASAPGTNGKSLNDLLMTGPTLQEDLFTILLRWRCYAYIFSADIAKMYRQVEVRPDDRKFQKFLYRDNEENDIQEYQHNMVPFGVTSATYLAVKSLQQLAVEEEKDFPEAAKVVSRDFYMDDGMSGSDTEADCIKKCKDVKELLARGKFDLRKFISNSTKVLESIPEADRELKLPLEINPDNTVKTLGVYYHPMNDSFQIKVNLPTTTEWPTKRSLLSETARLFDPLGWLAPVVISAKILFQKLWQEGLTWNQKLPQHIAKTWMEFRDELHLLNRIRINRWNGKGPLTKVFELHGFCDASEDAYSAEIYSRNVNHDGSIQIALLASKTRVAPINPITLARLELCGLVLLAELTEMVKKALDVDDKDIHAWTDSTIVLGWLRTKPAKLKTFVANRVVAIHNTFNVSRCHHIEGTQNPADCASRGIKPSELEKHDLWWNGPDVLRVQRASWEQELDIPETTLELKTKCLSTMVIMSSDAMEELSKRYSSFKQLVRITAICLKFIEGARKSRTAKVMTLCLTFINNLRDRIRKPKLLITIRDLRKAELRIIRLCQSRDFPNEIHHLAKNKPINTKSKLLPLNPLLDVDGCLRVGGRLKEANIPYNRKYPLILAQGTIAYLVIADAHERSMHGGIKLTMSLVRESYWVINLRRQVKRHNWKCVKCCRFRKGNSEQIMADLPWQRVNATSCFVHTGMDYAGPYKIKASNIRAPPIRIKSTIVNGEVVKAIPKVPVYDGYIALFVCLATKAIHLEVVSDMTTETFLAAFDRFTSSKGLPECCFSDNAKTFIGAKNILAEEEERSLLDSNRVRNHMSKVGVEWQFITPRAPNQGGIWESGVKSMKHHLKRIIGDQTLTYEEMSTVLAKIGACLNSRPLCPLNDDPDDLSVLTPGHFLIGRPLVARPQGNSELTGGGVRNRWRMVQKVQQDFWASWHQDYLNELQTRSKWLVKRRNFKEGDMVLLKEDNVQPTQWPLGRIVKVHPGRDDNVRSVTIKTTNEAGKVTELDRPILKLCLLPVNGDEDLMEEKESSNVH